MMTVDVKQIGEQVEKESSVINQIRAEIHKVIVGQEGLIDGLILALLCNNHVLIEGVPGLAKTLSVTTLAGMLQASFQRIQFLLEAMQERQVTIGEGTYPLDDPFLVMATQNPIEQEGTYPLPEAQVDRFMFKIRVSYPDKTEEHEILKKMARTNPAVYVTPILAPSDVKRLRALADEIYMDEKIEEYIVSLVEASRNPEAYQLDIGPYIRYGASPRASIFLAMASKANALIEGRGYVTPQDVKTIAMNVLRHRVILTYEAEAEEKTPEDIIEMILQTVDVP
jgi:MoxR-like ATPase